MFTSAILFEALLFITLGILVVTYFVCRSQDHKMNFGDTAKTLAWIAGTEFVLGLIVGLPFPAPTNDGVWQMMIASLLTILFSGSAWLLYLDAPTPAVVQSRVRREELRRQR